MTLFATVCNDKLTAVQCHADQSWAMTLPPAKQDCPAGIDAHPALADGQATPAAVFPSLHNSAQQPHKLASEGEGTAEQEGRQGCKDVAD